MTRRARGSVTTRPFLLVFLIIAMLAPAPAMAHAKLKRSSPSTGAQLSTAPQFIRLWFTEQPELHFTFATLKDGVGKTIEMGNAEQEASDRMGVAFRVLNTLIPGRYTLFWRTAASDGHPSNGSFSFVVLAGPQRETTSAREGTAPVIATSVVTKDTAATAELRRDVEESDAAGSIANSIARALLFVALLALIGAVSFALLIVRRAKVPVDLKQRMSQRAASLGMSATAVLIIVALVRLYLESQMMHAMPQMEDMAGMTIGEMLMGTTWGLSLRIQLVAAFAALIAFALARRRTGGWFVSAVSALVLSVTPALGGHAAASPRFTSLMVTADSLHVLAAGTWLGTLLCVMTVGVPIAMTLDDPGRWTSIASLVNTFSPLALISAGVVVASGTVASWVHLEHLAALWQTTYGQVLLVKLLFVAITFGIGAYNFRRVQPQLSSQVGTERLRRSAAAELGTAFLILLVTGLLTGISP